MQVVTQSLGSARDVVTRALEPRVKVPIVPQRVQGAVPQPRALAAGPTREERLEKLVAERDEQAGLHASQVASGLEGARNPALPAPERAGHLWGAVRGMMGRAVFSAAAGASRVATHTAADLDAQRYAAEFGAVPPTKDGAYRSTHECCVVTNGFPEPVVVHVTSTHLCVDGSGVRDAIALAGIASLVPSVALPTRDDVLYFVAVPDPRVRPNALQVYTTSGHCYQLLRFHTGARRIITDGLVTSTSTSGGGLPLEHFYVAADRAWRSAARIPHPRATYTTSS